MKNINDAIQTHRTIISWIDREFTKESKLGNPFKDRKWLLNWKAEEESEIQRIRKLSPDTPKHIIWGIDLFTWNLFNK
jgi:hypothetical protein